MVEIKYSIQFLTYWHAGSGLTSGALADAVVTKDNNGLPYFPGKTLKGIFRNAFVTLFENEKISQDEIGLFGQKNTSGTSELKAGTLFFSNAELPEKQALKARRELIKGLFDTLASTEINEYGVAENASLRVIEVCVPLTLEGKISGFKNEQEAADFSNTFAFTKSIGAHRNRGLGRCIIQRLLSND